ncbi:MAG: hypothetical protein IPM60_10375 [Rhodospirillales bacterium]|nr:hypothetical protein [Rhodospirillales bacterium]
MLVRSLWPAIQRSMPCRRQSVEHEETWFILAGYLLRPGFGVALDAARIEELWRVRDAGRYFPGKRIKLQEHILWRRVAGGLARDRQEQVLAGDLDVIRHNNNLPAELILLAGALERLGPELKAELIRRFIAIAEPIARESKHCTPILAALGMLLNRTPVYAGPETVVSPDLVEDCYDAFKDLDWSARELAELQTLFLRAARVVDNRTLDAPKALRHRIANKLERAGVAPAKTAALKQFTPLGRTEGTSLFGDSLPPGLLLRTDAP